MHQDKIHAASVTEQATAFKEGKSTPIFQSRTKTYFKKQLFEKTLILSAMKTAVHASSTFCAALAIFLLLCSTAHFSKAQRNKERPTAAPHFYDEYPVRRASIKKVVDGTNAALHFLALATTEQVSHSEKPNANNKGGKGYREQKIFTACLSHQRIFLYYWTLLT